ncbi:MAG: hypothetical protein IJR02_09025 [Bacteroidaceae bacterium]|nr:hypothetical protein [Bacteroidaceae bacterium]
MKTREEAMAKIRQSIAKKKAWLDRSDVELRRIYAERHGQKQRINIKACM